MNINRKVLIESIFIVFSTALQLIKDTFWVGGKLLYYIFNKLLEPYMTYPAYMDFQDWKTNNNFCTDL